MGMLATVIVATRPVVPELAVMARFTVPLPCPVLPDVIEIQGELLTAFHLHFDEAFTCNDSVAGLALGSQTLFGITENRQACFVLFVYSQYAVGVGSVG